jgi:hypothetical protein
VKVPDGLDEVRKVYGDPRPFMREDGRIMAAWERAILTYVPLPEPLCLGWDRSIIVRRIAVHRALAKEVAAILGMIHEEGNWAMLESFDGCYAWRAKRTSGKLSLHAWAAAIDFNAATNQMGRLGDMPEEIIEAFEDRGWLWGGRFNTPDPMHFQAARGY